MGSLGTHVFKLGEATVTEFMQFYMDDVVGDGNYVLGGVTVATIVSNVKVGSRSDWSIFRCIIDWRSNSFGHCR